MVKQLLTLEAKRLFEIVFLIEFAKTFLWFATSLEMHFVGEHFVGINFCGCFLLTYIISE